MAYAFTILNRGSKKMWGWSYQHPFIAMTVGIFVISFVLVSLTAILGWFLGPFENL
jgi:hypothetical protein